MRSIITFFDERYDGTGMQNIKNVGWYPYQIPFRTSFTTAHGVLTARAGVIVEITTEDGLSGIGEIAPLPEFAGDNLNTALAPLPMLSAQLCNKTLLAALDFLYANSHILPATTTCGLEIALLDAFCKHPLVVNRLCSFINKWDHTVNGVPVNAVIGAQNIETAITSAQETIAAGFHCIKLKMGADPEQEIARVAAIRNAIGPTIHLRLDANEAWTLDQAITILSHCADYDIQYIEQPLPAGDLEGMRKLRQEVPVPIAADEAVSDFKSARRVLDHAAADILIIKPQLVGGLRAGRQIIHEAVAHGVQCVITSAIEAGIGLAGALHLAAASPEVTLECGLATLHLLKDDLLLDDLLIENGILAVPAGPGLGVRLDRAALARYTNPRSGGIHPHPADFS